MKRSIKSILLCILSLLILCTLVSCKEKPEMKIRFFSAKNGDCTVVTSKGKALVIDCGNGVGTDIIEYLTSENIHVIDAMVISDFNDSHFNGAALLMDSFDVNKIYIPGYFCEGDVYDAFMDACDLQAIEPNKVDGSVAFPLGDTSVRVYAALNSIDVEKGDHSLMTRVVCDKRSFLICGDAEETRIKEFIEYDTNKYDLIKMPSHGSYYESLVTLIDNCKPDHAIITPAANVDSAKTRELLDNIGCDVYTTDTADHAFTCNGRKIEKLQG